MLHTRARNEKAVARALERQRVPYYLPLASVQRTYAKSKVTFRVPLFPGYVFLRGDQDDCEKAWKTNRVAKVLNVGNQDRFCAELQDIRRVVQSGQPVDMYPALRAGRRCRITSGPLRGVEGVVVRFRKPCRMYVAATILGQSAVIEVDLAALEAVE